MVKFDTPEDFGKQENNKKDGKDKSFKLADVVVNIEKLDDLYEILRKTETIQSETDPEYKFNTESIIEYLNSIRDKTAPDKLINPEIFEHLEKLGIGNKIIELLRKEGSKKEKIGETGINQENEEGRQTENKEAEGDGDLDAIKKEAVNDFLKVFESLELLNEEIGKDEKEEVIVKVSGEINNSKDDDLVDLALAKGIKEIKKIFEEIIREKDDLANDFREAAAEALELLIDKKMNNEKKMKINEEVLDLIFRMKKDVSLRSLKDGIKRIKEIIAKIKEEKG